MILWYNDDEITPKVHTIFVHWKELQVIKIESDQNILILTKAHTEKDKITTNEASIFL